MKVKSVLDLIGNTPVLNISSFFEEAIKKNIEVWIKLERSNPGGSIKDRIGKKMIEDAEAKGLLKKGSVIVEPTSGNTGIAIAMVAAIKGYRTVLVMPESMSVERRRILVAYGAELVLTPKEKGMKGAIERARELVLDIPNAWMPMQFENMSNPLVHKEETAKEILADFPNGVDYLITGVGTGGHISGIAEVLKEKFRETQVIAVEPEASPVLSGGAPGPHPIQGIGAGFIPATYNKNVVDRIIQIKKEEAFLLAQNFAKRTGVLAGISTGASLAAVAKELATIKEGSKVLTFNYDTGERYFSVDGLF